MYVEGSGAVLSLRKNCIWSPAIAFDVRPLIVMVPYAIERVLTPKTRDSANQKADSWMRGALHHGSESEGASTSK